MIDEVMFEIREMTNQTYKNVYAGDDDTGAAPTSVVGSVADHHIAERELATVI